MTSAVPLVPLRRYVTSIRDGTHGTHGRVLDGVPLLSAKNIRGGSVVVGLDESRITPDDYTSIHGSGYLAAGDVLLTIVGTIGRAAVYEGGIKVAFQRSVASLRPAKHCDARFLYYCLCSTLVQEQLAAAAHQSAQPGVYLGDVATVAVPLLPLDTQRKVAAYLDRETARIDALIAAKRQQVNLMDARLRLLARDLTTADGVDVPLRRVVRAVKTGTTPPAGVLARLSGGPVPWYSPADVGSWLQLSPADRTLNSAAITEGWVPRFPPGATLVIGIGATAGKVAFLDHMASGNQQITCLVPGHRVSPRFLAWQLLARQEELRAIAPFTTLPILNNEFMRSVSLALPPLARQAELVTRLDDEAKRCVALAHAVECQMSLIHERRRALITTGVTGQAAIPIAA